MLRILLIFTVSFLSCNERSESLDLGSYSSCGYKQQASTMYSGGVTLGSNDSLPEPTVYYIGPYETSYYDPVGDNIYLNIVTCWLDAPHEYYHHLQTLAGEGQRTDMYPGPLRRPQTPDVWELQGEDYYNRRWVEVQDLTEALREAQPSFKLVPSELIYNEFVNYEQYQMDWTLEGEANIYGELVLGDPNSAKEMRNKEIQKIWERQN